MKKQIAWGLYALAALMLPGAAAAGPIYADAAVLVRDEKGQPLQGVSVTLDYANPTETKKEKVKVDRNTGITNEHGIAVARAYFGSTDGNVKRFEVDRFLVTASKAGCKTFHETDPIYYRASRSGDRYTVYLHDIRMEPESSSEPSRVQMISLSPSAVVSPGFGDSSTAFTLTVKLQVPEILEKHLAPTMGGKPIFRVAAMVAVMNPEKPDVELADDGKAPDTARNDAIYTEPLRPVSGGPPVVEKISLVIRTQDDFHMLMDEKGIHQRWIVSKTSGIPGFSSYTRWNTVMATIVDVPVKWVVGEDPDKARALYKEKFGEEK